MVKLNDFTWHFETHPEAVAVVNALEAEQATALAKLLATEHIPHTNEETTPGSQVYNISVLGKDGVDRVEKGLATQRL